MTDTDILLVAKQVWQREAKEIQRLGEYAQNDSFVAVVRLLAEHKGRVITSGVGTSGVAARKGAHTLSCIEVPTLFLNPADAVHGAMGVVQPGDIVFLLSKGGGTEEITKLIPSLREKGTTLIAVTENRDSLLAMQSDLVLQVAVEQEADSFNMLATSSTVAVIAMFDAISVALMHLTRFTKKQFSIIHPGGAVGERLLHV